MPANSKGLDFFKPSGEPLQQLSGIQSLASCFSTAAGSFMITGALNSTIVVNDVGFQPKALLLWANGRTDAADAAGRRTHQRSFGVATGPTDRRYMTSLAQDTPTAMLTNAMQGSAACLGITTTADAVDGFLDVQSFNAGGFTLIIDDAFTANYRVQYLALGGSELTNAATGQFSGATGTVTQDITTLSFQPDCVIFFSTGQASSNNTVRSDSRITMGAATSSSQAVWAGGSNDAAATSQAMSYCRTGEIIATFDTTVTNLENRAQFVSFLSNGFRIQWVENTTPGQHYYFIALKGGRYAIDNLLTQTDTTTDIVETFGFTPEAALFVSHGKAQNSADTPTDDDEWSIGAWSDLTNRVSMSAADDDAAATAIVSSGISYDEVYQNLNANTGAVEGEMDLKSIDTNGMTLIMDDADPVQAFVWYIAFGCTPVTPPSSNVIHSVLSDDFYGVLFGGQVVR